MDRKYTLNDEQRALVEQNLHLIDIIIRKHISVNESVRGLEYDELYSTGCMALCVAAFTYDGSVKFVTYASRVIQNRLIDQCRKASREHKQTLSLDNTLADGDDDFGDVIADDSNTVGDMIAKADSDRIISDAKRRYKGAVLKGVEAIELRLKGYSGAEIAKLYGVGNNNVTSWISKATAKLRIDYEY